VETTLIQLAYLVAAVLFILGLRNLSSPKTAALGNILAAIGMLIAIVATMLVQEVMSYGMVLAGLAIGGAIGGLAATRIEMTAMPQMVALLNGFGGAASALVAGAEAVSGVETGGIVPTAMVLSVLIGSMTLTGSLVAFAKLQELIGGAPVQYPLQQATNALIALGAVALCVMLAIDPGNLPMLGVLVAVALVFGVLIVIPIGGADMPVVISLLNSYSGIAACARALPPVRRASCSTTVRW